ncbi:MAG: SDR family oxidoreductase [Flavobacteriaceae bacterium]|nr:SDR family oxidoreductase [Flavobacteriaceae bacterium]
MKEFDNEWAIILGGSSGLGLATAKKLAHHGLNICIVHRDRKASLDELNAAFDAIRSYGVEVMSFNKDALKAETIDEVIGRISDNSLKVLVHSIARGSVKPFFAEDKSATISSEDLKITIDAMGLSWHTWTKALVENEKFSSNARNIAFTSEGNTRAWKSYGAVSAAKATLEALMRQMAIELPLKGITTNCIQAGLTLTKSFEHIPGSEKMAKFTTARNPFKRLTTPEDVANVVYLLCKDEASWINGVVLKADGGESLS